MGRVHSASGDGVLPTRQPSVGEHERHLAISTVAQQISQMVTVLSALVSITVLARTLSLSEFGAYGLLVSLTGYVLFVQGSIETAAVKAVAEANDQVDRDRAFSTAITLYAMAGAIAGAAIAGPGSAALGLFNIPAALRDEAQMSIFALALVTLVGWPLKVFHDVLRGTQRFVASASAEIATYVAIAGALVALALNGAPLWLLVGVGASAPCIIGSASAVIVVSTRLPFSFRRESLSVESVGSFVGLSKYLFLSGISGLVIYSLDRAVLSAFRSSATVALYEGPVRAHNLVQQVNSTLSIPVVPAASRYLASGDVHRARELLLRGTRYSLAVVIPPTIVLMVLSGPILEVWLGDRFGVAATPMTLLVAYWLLNANTGVAGGMLVAAGQVKPLTLYAIAVAMVNLALSLALTPSLGLNGVVLGTTLSYVLGFPFFLALVRSALPVSIRALAHEAWLPAYATGAVVAGGLLALRLSLPLESVSAVAGAALGAVLAYWAIYYLAWLRPNERLLVRSVASALFRR